MCINDNVGQNQWVGVLYTTENEIFTFWIKLIPTLCTGSWRDMW